MNEAESVTPQTKQAAIEPSMFDSPEWTGVQPPAPRSGHGEPIIGIRFQPVGKVYHYNASGFPNLKPGQWVIVDTARGRQMGQVATLKPPRAHGGPYKRIERMATGRDMAMRHYYENRELEAMIACRAESAGLRLPIKIVRAEYSFDGQTLTFLFSSDEEERIEVGALRERMSHLYRARLEFRQISPREVAKLLGGLGACGIEERCCSRFLTEFSPISIKHAKEQNLSLNPHDITGMCGRLRCCLVYEFEQYVAARSALPKVKSVIGTPMGEGKVVEILHLRDSVKVRLGDGPEAREMIFHREQLTPLEELRRLQEKAMSGTCDKHEGGGCDCGRKGAKDAKDAKESQGAPPTSEAAANEQAAPAPRVRDPQRDAQIRARQEKVKAQQQQRQERRDEVRRQLKHKAQQQQQQGGEGDARRDAPRPESNERRERPERSERRDQNQRGPQQQQRGGPPQQQQRRPLARRDAPRPQRPPSTNADDSAPPRQDPQA
jgi:cell fate regulator YaaT (PSP1 superfamily)